MSSTDSNGSCSNSSSKSPSLVDNLRDLSVRDAGENGPGAAASVHNGSDISLNSATSNSTEQIGNDSIANRSARGMSSHNRNDVSTEQAPVSAPPTPLPIDRVRLLPSTPRLPCGDVIDCKNTLDSHSVMADFVAATNASTLLHLDLDDHDRGNHGDGNESDGLWVHRQPVSPGMVASTRAGGTGAAAVAAAAVAPASLFQRIQSRVGQSFYAIGSWIIPSDDEKQASDVELPSFSGSDRSDQEDDPEHDPIVEALVVRDTMATIPLPVQEAVGLAAAPSLDCFALPADVPNSEERALLDEVANQSTATRLEPWWQAQWVLVRLSGLVIVALVLAISLLVSPFKSADTLSPFTQRRDEQIANFINNITLSDQVLTLEDAKTGIGQSDNPSTEVAAMRWLVYNDPLQLTPNTTVNKVHMQQRYALATLWGPQMALASVRKNVAQHECDWDGVWCNTTDIGDVVTEIRLACSNWSGHLSIDLGLLSSLVHFDISHNAVTGSLPSSIANWTDLEYFNIESNTLTGPLPEAIGQWISLQYFEVSSNALNGSLPSSMSGWTDLEYFGVWNNALTGKVQIGLPWANLKQYNVWGRRRNGTIQGLLDPVDSVAQYIGNISLMADTEESGHVIGRILNWLLANDLLKDVVPDSPLRQFKLRQRYALATVWAKLQNGLLVALSNYGRDECGWVGVTCELLDLGNDIGTVLAVTGINLGKDQSKYLWEEKVRVLDDLGLLTTLVRFDAAVTGSLPTSIGQWRNLECFNVREGYNGGLSGSLPDTIGSWSELKVFNLASNSVTGSMPTSVGNWSKLKFFSLAENDLVGELPVEVGQWTALEYFDVSENWGLNGSLPGSIRGWRNMTYFNVMNTGLTSRLPDFLVGWRNLQYAYMAESGVVGNLSKELCSISALREVNLDCDKANCSCGQVVCKCGGMSFTRWSSAMYCQ